MPLFQVSVYQTCEGVVTLEAASLDDAQEQVERMELPRVEFIHIAANDAAQIDLESYGWIIHAVEAA